MHSHIVKKAYRPQKCHNSKNECYKSKCCCIMTLDGMLYKLYFELLWLQGMPPRPSRIQWRPLLLQGDTLFSRISFQGVRVSLYGLGWAFTAHDESPWLQSEHLLLQGYFLWLLCREGFVFLPCNN
jgi:hypothetical protein